MHIINNGAVLPWGADAGGVVVTNDPPGGTNLVHLDAKAHLPNTALYPLQTGRRCCGQSSETI
jgi:hypothetical protein